MAEAEINRQIMEDLQILLAIGLTRATDRNIITCCRLKIDCNSSQTLPTRQPRILFTCPSQDCQHQNEASLNIAARILTHALRGDCASPCAPKLLPLPRRQRRLHPNMTKSLGERLLAKVIVLRVLAGT